MEDSKNSPVLLKPNDETLLKRLTKKLAEYKSRMVKATRTRHPDWAYEIDAYYRDALYKSIVLERLLEKGSVNTWDLCRELAKKYKQLDGKEFDNACAVIAIYCGQLDVKPKGGTGLPEA